MKKFITIALLFVMLFTTASSAFASETGNIRQTNAAADAALQTIDQVECFFAENETTLSDIMSQEISRLEAKKQIVTDENTINQIDNLIADYREIIAENQRYKAKSFFVTSGIGDDVLIAAVNSAIAYFLYNNCYLSAELLTHAKNGNGVDIYPTQFDNIYGTSEYSRVVNLCFQAQGADTSGQVAFTETTPTAEKDMYYAMKNCNFTYFNRILKFNDLYDFAFDPGQYDEIVGTAVNAMYLAQQRGIIDPFNFSINIGQI